MSKHLPTSHHWFWPSQVTMFAACKSGDGVNQIHKEMVDTAWEIVQGLGLPARLVSRYLWYPAQNWFLCSGVHVRCIILFMTLHSGDGLWMQRYEYSTGTRRFGSTKLDGEGRVMNTMLELKELLMLWLCSPKLGCEVQVLPRTTT